MPQETSVVSSATNSLAEVVERILDKGIVIDAWVSVSVIGIELITIEARVIVASVETYAKYAAVLGYLGPVAGGFREPTKRKSLGEGLQDLSQGLQSTLQSVPALGNAGNVGNTVGSLTGGLTGKGRQREMAQAGASRERSTSKASRAKSSSTRSKGKRGRAKKK